MFQIYENTVAIHLAVIDILYNKNKCSLETNFNPTSEDSKNEESDNEFEVLDSLDINRYKLPVPELLHDYTNIICKVEKFANILELCQKSILLNHVKQKY